MSENINIPPEKENKDVPRSYPFREKSPERFLEEKDFSDHQDRTMVPDAKNVEYPSELPEEDEMIGMTPADLEKKKRTTQKIDPEEIARLLRGDKKK